MSATLLLILEGAAESQAITQFEIIDQNERPKPEALEDGEGQLGGVRLSA